MTSWAGGVMLVGFNLLMTPTHIPLWRCFSSNVPPKLVRKILHFLSQLRFDGEGETTVSKHVFNFWKFCGSHNITNDNVICMLFTLTFTGWSRASVRLCRPPLFTDENNLCVNFCMLLRIIIIINCVKKFQNLGRMKRNLLNIFFYHIYIYLL